MPLPKTVDLRGEWEEIDMAYKQEQGKERMKMEERDACPHCSTVQSQFVTWFDQMVMKERDLWVRW
jgi:hypothetical protein